MREDFFFNSQYILVIRTFRKYSPISYITNEDITCHSSNLPRSAVIPD